MKKQILNLGKALNKTDQKQIKGGLVPPPPPGLCINNCNLIGILGAECTTLDCNIGVCLEKVSTGQLICTA